MATIGEPEGKGVQADQRCWKPAHYVKIEKTLQKRKSTRTGGGEAWSNNVPLTRVTFVNRVALPVAIPGLP